MAKTSPGLAYSPKAGRPLDTSASFARRSVRRVRGPTTHPWAWQVPARHSLVALALCASDGVGTFHRRGIIEWYPVRITKTRSTQTVAPYFVLSAGCGPRHARACRPAASTADRDEIVTEAKRRLRPLTSPT